MMETESVWQTYTKVCVQLLLAEPLGIDNTILILQNHKGSSRFCDKGFAFYDEMQQLVPQKPFDRGQHGYNPSKGANTSHVRKNKHAGAAAATTTTTTSSPGAATSPPNVTGSSTIDPDAIPQSAPSSYLTSSSLSNVTGSSSVSHGKCKVESVSSTSHKRTRPQTATAQAQLDGSTAMQDIATAFKDISCSFDYGTTHPPATDLSSVVTLLGRHTELSMEDVVLLAEYFSQLQILSQATIFQSLPDGARSMWLQWRLADCHVAMQT